ncbi:class III chitinase ChiA2 [Xylogone sp. PMI_703]|nr:class III chitinase ChiA2 [Xylogone sp. PMI_703]
MYTSLLVLAGLLDLSTSFAIGPNVQQAVYWGQSPEQASLAHFCNPSQGIDIIPLAFLSQYGTPNVPGGSVGDCDISASSSGPISSACQQVARDIQYCQSQKKLIVLSLGGGGGSGGLSSQADAEALATQLWAMYGPVQKGYTGPRPLGNITLDGFDLDIENNLGAYNYVFFVWKLRDLFATDPTRKYYITGAPQCVVPDASMGDMIFNSPFDYLFIQFYNTPTCSARGELSGYLPENGHNQYFTFDAWREFTRTAHSQSIQSKLLIGLPASSTAADNDENYYLEPQEALELVDKYRTHEGFAGVMLWDAGSSDSNVVNGCTYSQQISSILHKGRTC